VLAFRFHGNRSGSFSPSRERLRQNSPRTQQLRLSQPSGRLLSLSVLRTRVFRSLIAYQAFYRLDLAQNFFDLALLATQGCRYAFQNTVSDGDVHLERSLWSKRMTVTVDEQQRPVTRACLRRAGSCRTDHQPIEQAPRAVRRSPKVERLQHTYREERLACYDQVVALRKPGMSHAAIAEHMGMGASTVSNWLAVQPGECKRV